MAGVQIIGLDGRVVEVIDGVDSMFGTVSNPHLVHQAVVMQQACARQGTAASKGRGEVNGSGKKPWKQKHTGRARAGSTRSPIWRHGGTVFGPKPRSYRLRMTKAAYRLALRNAISSKFSAQAVVVLSEVSLPEMKSRHLIDAFNRLGVIGSVLMVVDRQNADLERVARNLARVRLIKIEALNVYDVLRVDRLVLTREAFEKMKELWGEPNP